MRVLSLVAGGWALKDARLEMRPGNGVVLRGNPVTLICEYDLEGAPLYSVKWYRGNREFFRHIPKDVPTTKLFPFQGLLIDVSIIFIYMWIEAPPGRPIRVAGSLGAQLITLARFLLIASNFQSRSLHSHRRDDSLMRNLC